MSGEVTRDVDRMRQNMVWAGRIEEFVKPTLSDDDVAAIMAAQKARIAHANGDRVVPTTITRQMRRHPDRFVQKHFFRPSPRTSRRRSRRGMPPISETVLAAALSASLMSNARR